MKARLALAALIAAGIGAWMYTGDLVVSGTAQEAQVRPPAERQDADRERFQVRVATLSADIHERALTVRGRTRADALVEVAAETPGRVAERPVTRGSRVDPGEVLCRLDPGVREAQLAQAKAEVAKAQLEFDAATSLQGRGFESETRVAATRAALDAAEAAVAAATQELERTVVRAPIEGVVQEPLAEVGATLAVGQTCATIVDGDPMVFTGQVSEREIPDVEVGREATVHLLTGEVVEGEVRYISPTADVATRTFNVEIEVPNPERRLRDGVTAEARIPLPSIKAHRLSPGVLTLSDEGIVGVRAIEGNERVAFMPVDIVEQAGEGFWVAGLPDEVTIITVGQDYVVDGQIVEPVRASDPAGIADGDGDGDGDGDAEPGGAVAPEGAIKAGQDA